MREALLIVALWAGAMTCAGPAHASSLGRMEAKTHLTAVGTAAVVLRLETDARLVTRDDDYIRLDEADRTSSMPTANWHDDLSISSTANSVALILEKSSATGVELRLAFVSHATRVGRCELPDCGRYEHDIHWLGPPPELPEGDGGMNVHWLKAGDYTLAVVAPAGARTTATLQLDIEGSAVPAETSVTLLASPKGTISAWASEELTADPAAGSTSVEVDQRSSAIANVTAFHRFGSKDNPATPLIELTFMGVRLPWGSGTTSVGSFTRLTMYDVIEPGSAHLSWRVNTSDVDRRAVAWLLVW